MRLIPADNGLKSKLLRNKIEKLLTPDYISAGRERAIDSVIGIANEIRIFDDCGHKNVEKGQVAYWKLDNEPAYQPRSWKQDNEKTYRPKPWELNKEPTNQAKPSTVAPPTLPIESTHADFARQMQAATGVAVPDTVEAHQAYIEDPDGTVPNVNVTNLNEFVTVLKEIKDKMPTGETIFDSTFRAFAHIKEPAWETESEFVHRRRQSKEKWNDIALAYYPDTKPEDLKSVVDLMQKRYYLAYPKDER
jgi:hypothetical protein